jgi:hypothetical protein
MMEKQETWLFTDHACRSCCGRILKRRLNKLFSCYICAKCGTRVIADHESAICWCGVAAGTHGKIFECIRNPNKRAESPNEVLVREKKVILKPPEVKIHCEVYCEDSFRIDI